MSKSGIARLAVLFAIIAVTIALCMYVPGVRDFVRELIAAAQDPDELEKFALSYSGSGPVVVMGLTLLQCVITFIPLAVVMILATMLMGFWKGVAVSIVAQVIVAYLTMLLTRYFSRPLIDMPREAEKFSKVKDLIQRYGSWGILVARLVPLGSFDLVNFAAGLLNVRDRDFLLGTLIGIIPATCFYGAIGINLYNLNTASSAIFCLVSGIIIAAVLVVHYLLKRKRHAPEAPSAEPKKTADPH